MRERLKLERQIIKLRLRGRSRMSGLLSRPWHAYNALVAAYESQVIEKLLFGSDFPYTSITECIEALYSINQIAQGTNLPVVPRESLRGIVERDSLGLLGLT